MKRLLIFDLDGTLVNSLPDIAWAMNQALKDWELPERSLQEIQEFIGSGTLQLVERACGGNIPPGLVEAYRRYYDDNLIVRTKVYPGLNKLLPDLKQDHLVVLTNKYQSAADRIIDQLFPDIFESVLGDGRFPRKPDPTAIEYLMDYYQVTPRETILIGDSRVDQAAAQAAGIHFIGVDWGYDILTEAISIEELKQQLRLEKRDSELMEVP